MIYILALTTLVAFTLHAAPLSVPDIATSWKVDGRFFRTNRHAFTTPETHLIQALDANYTRNITTKYNERVHAEPPFVPLETLATTVVSKKEVAALKKVGITMEKIKDAASNYYMMYAIINPECIVSLKGALVLKANSPNWKNVREFLEKEYRKSKKGTNSGFVAKNWEGFIVLAEQVKGAGDALGWEDVRKQPCEIMALKGDEFAQDDDPISS